MCEINVQHTHYIHITELIKWQDDWNPSVVSSFCTFLLAEHWWYGQKKPVIVRISGTVMLQLHLCPNQQCEQTKKTCVLSQQWAACTRGSQRMRGLQWRKRTQTSSSEGLQDELWVQTLTRLWRSARVWLELHLARKIRSEMSKISSFTLCAKDEILVHLKRQEVHQASVLSCSKKTTHKLIKKNYFIFNRNSAGARGHALQRFLHLLLEKKKTL